MTQTPPNIPDMEIKKRYKDCAIQAPPYPSAATTLSQFLDILSTLITGEEAYWFRGHASINYRLVPSALRYNKRDQRNSAISGIREVQQVLSYKLPRPPAPTERLNWLQIAQHYGFPTRLLDWTQNPVVALYFACCHNPDKDGLVVVMRPLELNAEVNPNNPRLFNYEQDRDLIDKYIDLDGVESRRRNKRTIAVVPSWDHERIYLQQGFFTLHGSKQFEIDSSQVSSLTYIPVPQEAKARMIKELSRVGMGEMFVYPEPEHACNYLRQKKGLI